jgi:hypothetical protein
MKRAHLFNLPGVSFLLCARETETMRKNDEILRQKQEEPSALRQEIQNREAKEQ